MFVFKIRERICHPLIHHRPYKLNFWTTPISGAAKILSEHGSGMFWIKTDFHPHALFIPSNGLIVGIKNHCFRMLSDWSADSHDILLLVPRCMKNAEHSVKAENSIENSAPTVSWIPSATGFFRSTGFLSPWVPDSSRFMTMTCAAVILGFVMGPWWASQNLSVKLSNQRVMPWFLTSMIFVFWALDAKKTTTRLWHKTCRTTKPRAQLHRKASLVQVIPWVPCHGSHPPVTGTKSH